MNIDSILVQDTNGELVEDIVKNDFNKESLSVWFTEENKTLNFSANNVRYDTVPNIEDSTYLTYLTYNGTSGYINKLFSYIVAQDSGVFDRNAVPTLTYSPYDIVEITDSAVLEDVVLDIKMYNGTIDVLNYTDTRMNTGTLSKGSSSFTVQSSRSFPTKVDTLPNVSNKAVFLDGWYSYTQIIFRDISNGDAAVCGNYYTSKGNIFKAVADGYFYNDSTDNGYIINSDGTMLNEGMELQSNLTYQEILFSLNETSGISPQSNSVYLHSQVLITEQLRVAILNEVIEAACTSVSGCEFMDWQKLSLKRIASYVMFDNGLFEKSQIILESAREMCKDLEYNLNC